MILNIYAVRDQKTDQFGNPMFLISSGQALRSFGDEVNRADKDNMLNKHPGDFELYSLGSWDTDTGEFQTHKPKQVITASELIIKADQTA